VSSLKTFADAASEFGKDAKEAVGELGRSASRKLDDARDQTAGTLHNAASSVRSAGRQGSEAIDNLATGAADRLDTAAAYVDNYDPRDVFNGVRNFVRRRPTASLVAAAAIGFVAGVTLIRAVHSCES
jgi:ElaB/YqjD/DUF883 family membrane-anchored ribosome-binding protein